MQRSRHEVQFRFYGEKMNCEVGASNISSWQMAMKSAALRIFKQDPAFRDLTAKVDFIFFEIHAATFVLFDRLI